MPKKRLSAIVDRGVREKKTTGRAGIRWGSVVEKVRKDMAGNQEDVVSAETFGKYKAEEEERTEMRERLALQSKV